MITSELRIEKAGMDDDSDYLCRSSDMQTDDVKVHVLNGTSRNFSSKQFMYYKVKIAGKSKQSMCSKAVEFKKRLW